MLAADIAAVACLSGVTFTVQVEQADLTVALPTCVTAVGLQGAGGRATALFKQVTTYRKVV